MMKKKMGKSLEAVVNVLGVGVMLALTSGLAYSLEYGGWCAWVFGGVIVAAAVVIAAVVLVVCYIASLD
jgi:hypothetical protein